MAKAVRTVMEGFLSTGGVLNAQSSVSPASPQKYQTSLLRIEIYCTNALLLLVWPNRAVSCVAQKRSVITFSESHLPCASMPPGSRRRTQPGSRRAPSAVRTRRTAPVPPTNPKSRVKSPRSGPSFVLALAGIRRLAVQAKAVEKDNLIPLGGLADAYQAWGSVQQRASAPQAKL